MDDKLNGFLIGSVLGDGCFIKKSNNHNTYIRFSHCRKQIEYLEWKYNFLKQFNVINDSQEIKLIKRETRHAYPNASDQFAFSTKSMKELNRYKEIRKIDLLKEFNEISLAVWLLDDGNIYNRTCKISCGKLTDDERCLMVEILKEKFDIEANIYHHKINRSKDYFRISGKYFSKLQDIVISSINCNIDIVCDKFDVGNVCKTIKIKYHDKDIAPLCKTGGNKSDWIDLRAAEDIELKQGEFKLISLGVSMELPKGYEAHVAPRSSTYKNFGIICANSFGIIDNTYCGDNDIWRFPAIALKDAKIRKNDRICQFRIVENQPEIEFEEVKMLGNADRGGIGSTGVK